MIDEPSRLTCTLLTLLLSLFLTGAFGKTHPETNIIRVIGIGESYIPETELPLLIEIDPKLRYQPVPANWYEGSFSSVGSSRDDAVRFVRQYMPRTYEGYVDAYDVTILSDFEVDILMDFQFVWMERAAREEGMGLGKYEMNWDPGHWGTFDMFIASAVYPAMPADLKRGGFVPKPLDGIQAVKLPGTGKPHPIVDLPEMRKYSILGAGDYGYEIPRPGAIVIAKFTPKGEDAIIIRSYGKGNTLACLPGLDKIDDNAVAQWRYMMDFWINQMWYLADVEIPEDIQLVHAIRERTLTYLFERVLATSLIDFVVKFGAPTLKLQNRLGEIDEIKWEADRLYLEESYSGSFAKLEEAFDGLVQLAEDSVEVKNEALFWIFVVEWMVVTGTASLARFTVWTLMVRRRLYREVRVTRSV